MKKVLHFGEQTVVLIYQDDLGEIDIDQITSIDHSNIYGEIVTCSVLMNKVGMLKAEAEAVHSETKLNCSIYESSLRKRLRREALLNNGKVNVNETGAIKLTESSLDELIFLDKGYQSKRKELIEAKKDLDFMDSIFWSVQSKDRKLNNLVPKVTPKEFYAELIEGRVNTIMIKKL